MALPERAWKSVLRMYSSKFLILKSHFFWTGNALSAEAAMRRTTFQRAPYSNLWRRNLEVELQSVLLACLSIPLPPSACRRCSLRLANRPRLLVVESHTTTHPLTACRERLQCA